MQKYWLVHANWVSSVRHKMLMHFRTVAINKYQFHRTCVWFAPDASTMKLNIIYIIGFSTFVLFALLSFFFIYLLSTFTCAA